MEKQNALKEIRSAMRAGELDSLQNLFDEDPSRVRMGTSFGTLLHEAATIGNLAIVRLLVERGIDVNSIGKNTSGATAIDRAASKGNLDIVEYLLDNGAKMDVSEPDRNPLFAAIYGGHYSVALALIERGIDTSVRYTGPNMKDMDAIGFAEKWGRKDIAKLIKEKHAGAE